MLEVRGIDTFYGLAQALSGVSLTVDEGEVVALLGRNGSGKTTTLRSIIGLTPPSGGSIRLNGADVRGLPTHAVARLGAGYVPEDRRIFPGLTVGENLLVATRGSNGRDGGWSLERVYGLFSELKPLHSRKGGTLSGGEQQMLAIARALMGNPRLLLLDEPSEGLAPLVVRRLADQVRALRDNGMAVLLTEQNVRFALELCGRAYIMEKGRVRFSGSAEELRHDEESRSAYLGL